MPRRTPKPDPFVTRWRDARRAIVAAEKAVTALIPFCPPTYDPWVGHLPTDTLEIARLRLEAWGRAVTARATDAAKARGR